jgi:hypothetical protein
MENTKQTEWTDLPKWRKVTLIVTGAVISLSVATCTHSCLTDDKVSHTTETVNKVENSSLDGSVWHIEQYLKHNLNDAESYEAVEWGTVKDIGTGLPHRYIVRHKYRAKNQYNATILKNQIFYLDSTGKVLNIKDWE